LYDIITDTFWDNNSEEGSSGLLRNLDIHQPGLAIVITQNISIQIIRTSYVFNLRWEQILDFWIELQSIKLFQNMGPHILPEMLRVQ